MENETPAVFDSSRQISLKLLGPDGIRVAQARFPTDGEWIDRTRRRKIMRISVGRGKSTTTLPEPGEADTKLFAKLLIGEEGTPDPYESARVLEVLAACEHLVAVAARYVFMSTVSVYRGWPVVPLSETSELLSCPADAGPDYGEDVEDGPTKYGYQKSGCELAVAQTFGADRSTVLRPGVILGPREYVGRLPWWLDRVAVGGRVLAPGLPGRSIQPIDVRDLAGFAVRSVADGISGAYNATAPAGRETFGAMLAACGAVTGSDAEFVWIPDEQLVACGVRQWSEMPLWRTFPGVWQVDSGAAHAQGLECRPLAETVSATWAWMQGDRSGADDERASEIGMSRDREERILACVA